MADVNLIINSLNTIANAAYHKPHDDRPPSSRKTGHQIAFETLQGTAAQLEAVFRQNPAPNRDSRENIAAQFAAMKKNVDVYCAMTVETRPGLIAFNNASTEWELLRRELGD
jgi:hypothetical protein